MLSSKTIKRLPAGPAKAALWRRKVAAPGQFALRQRELVRACAAILKAEYEARQDAR